LEFVFRTAAKELFGVNVDQVHYKSTRNQDLKVTELEIDGKVVLSFATAYGFRNIQNVVRKIKQNKCNYHFIEVMACPGGIYLLSSIFFFPPILFLSDVIGCTNGGGQIKPEKNESVKELLKKVDDVFDREQVIRTPAENIEATQMYKLWLNGVFSPDAKTNLHTQSHAIEKLLNPLAIKW
jgi:iron only hydrogenase large subunit-like protein